MNFSRAVLRFCINANQPKTHKEGSFCVRKNMVIIMKRLICIFCCAALMFSSLCLNACAAQTEQYVARDSKYGDANDDGTVNLLDLILLRKYIVKMQVNMNYENIDINGDCKINLFDLIALRKMMVKMTVQYGQRFSKDNLDINSTVEDLGIPLASTWPDSGMGDKISARNPFDMVAFNNNVYISCGNYSTNEGPIKLIRLSRNDKIRKTVEFQTEQANKFYIYDDRLFTLAVDPKAWLTGSYYTCDKNKSWVSHDILANNIHCYDMIKHNGKYFFAGSNVEYDDNNKELSNGVVFSCSEEDVTLTNRIEAFQRFSLVPFINKYGDTINMTDHSYGVPRVYELMEFKGVLYAMYYNYVEENFVTSMYPDTRFDGLECNGVYKYNDEKQQFEYCEGLNILDQFKGNIKFNQDRETVMTDFEWNGQYIVINDGISATNDLKTWETISIPEYEDYAARDCQVIGDKLYILANVKVKDGQWTNAVFETSDLKTFRRILYFDTVSWLRSFAYTNGAFFFCVGAYSNEISEVKWISNVKHEKVFEYGTECGRVYRYIYYK